MLSPGSRLQSHTCRPCNSRLRAFATYVDTSSSASLVWELLVYPVVLARSRERSVR